MSGAGREKGDGSDDEYLFEIKDRTGRERSYRVREAELLSLWRQAVAVGKEPVLIIEFGEIVAYIAMERNAP